MKEIESAKALSSLFYPKFWKDMKALLLKCEMISDSIKALEFEAIADIEFMFSNGKKQKVYCELIHAIKNGWFRVDQRRLAIYLAEHTNLADSPNLETRVNTIVHFLSKYKRNFT